MADFFNSLLSHADAFRWMFFIGLLWAFYRWMNSEDSNGIEWRDFVSAQNAEGKFHGDINRLGQSVGIFIGSMAIVQVAPHAHKDFLGFAAVLGVYFAFVAGAAGYSAYLRSKQGTVTTVTEPAQDQLPMKTTVTEAPPVKDKG